MWKRGFFAIEYKGKHKDLDAAYNQLKQYQNSLENPPLLIVCDMTRLIVYTHFTGKPTTQTLIVLEESAIGGETLQAAIFEQLRDIFFHPERFEPQETIEAITERAASKLGGLALTMGKRYEPEAVARFLDRIVFCLFAEDIDLLPATVFSRLLESNRYNVPRCCKLIGDLFGVMAVGGDFGEHSIRRFNGNLFNEELRFELTESELNAVIEAAKLDWKNVDPSIFGTLFERGLDPNKRSQLGAHYTSRADIETLIEPVIMAPLRREWDAVRSLAGAQPVAPKIAPESKGAAGEDANLGATGCAPTNSELIRQFLARLAAVRVLDPACGSGNFLYIALQKLKDLEKSVLTFARDRDLGEWAPTVSPLQLFGLELNAYAFDLAQTTVWIGYLQWLRANGYLFTEDPVLRKTDNFRNADAILDLSGELPREAQWPEADFIVGNPPFLGGSRLWEELGRDYQQKLWGVYQNRVPGGADLCCYWFEKTRGQIADGQVQRAGLIATQSIRGGVNREVLKRIKQSGDIFFAVSDRDWILNGANVHISIVAFDNGSETSRVLDGQPVAAINADLSSATDVTQARKLAKNSGICFIGAKKAGKFEFREKEARPLLYMPNPHGKPNSDVLRPWVNAAALTQGREDHWIIDAGAMQEDDFALYEHLYFRVEALIKPERMKNNEERARRLWWQHRRPSEDMQTAVNALPRYIATPRHSKHRVFVWLTPEILSDDGIYVFARDDDYFFGVVHSRLHEVWARAQGTQLRERESGFRYTPTSCFETFPFPARSDEQHAAISAAAKNLDTLRRNWLNPPEWTREEILEFPGSVSGPWSRYVEDADERGLGTVRYPRRVPKDAILAMNFVKRTLTNLYNERPAWLDNAHKKLDAAVFAAYDWPASLSDDEILARFLELNHERATP